MSQAAFSFLVTRGDESAARGQGSSSIETLGAPAAAIDIYRIAAIESSNLNDFSFALTDVTAAAALERIATGPISSISELMAAETALAALLLYDQVDVLTCAPKLDTNGQLVSRWRMDRQARGDLAYKIFGLAQSHDWLIAPEFAVIANGKVSDSTLKGSTLIGASIEELDALQGKYWNPAIEGTMLYAVAAFEAPTYLAAPRLAKAFSADNLHKRLYSRVNISWKKHVAAAPARNILFAFPPFLSIVFDRMANRQDLLPVIRELREELNNVRSELFELNRDLERMISQRDLDARARQIEEAFSAIVPESRMTNAQRNRRKIAGMFGMSKPIVNLFAAFQKGQMSLDEFAALSVEAETALFTRERIVDRTITSKTFADLLDTWNLAANVRNILSAAEIASINVSLSE